MKPVLSDVKAKVAPFLEDAAAEAKPFGHALGYCVVWLAWLALLPFVIAGAWIGSVSKKIKPELPKVPAE